jgi:hypothetical protein
MRIGTIVTVIAGNVPERGRQGMLFPENKESQRCDFTGFGDLSTLFTYRESQPNNFIINDIENRNQKG